MEGILCCLFLFGIDAKELQNRCTYTFLSELIYGIKKFYLFCRRLVYRYANRSTSHPGTIALGLDIRVQSLLYDETKQKNF